MKTNLFVLFFFCFSLTNYAQVGIGTTDPNPAAILDIQSDHAGLLIPRIALTGSDDAATIANPVKGLVVFNTAATGTISEGFVFYDGSAWVDLGWQLQGNYAGANSFIGTLNDIPLVFKAENKTIGFLRPNGAVGFGLNSSATAMSSFAIGNGAATNGSRSYALGSGATTSAADAFAIGTNAVADRQNTIILSGVNQNVGIGTSNPQAKFHLSGSFRFEDGNQAAGKVLTSDANGTVSWQTPAATSGSGWELTGNSGTNASTNFLGTTDNQPLNFRVNNIAVGSIKTDNSLQFGRTATASGARSIAVGFESTASSDESAAFGRAATASGARSTAIGFQATASRDESTAIGRVSVATGARSTAVGFESRAQADESSAYGRGANASAARSTAIGFETTATADDATAVGRNADASAARSTATGYNALASNTDANAFGSGATASAASSLALGTGASARGNSSVAVGMGAISRNQSAMAYGFGAEANGNNSLSIGVAAVTSAQNAVALGSNASAGSSSAVALGQNSNSSGLRATSIGTGTQATAQNATALGNGSRAFGQNSTAIGNGAFAPNDNTLILGNNANVGIGTNTPSAKLHVDGTLRYVDGNQAVNRVLTSDANGNASWQAPNTVIEAYGEMYGDNLGGVSESGTFTRSLNASTVLKNVTHNDTDYYLQVAISGNYKISYSVSVYARNNNDRDFEFFVERAPNNNTYTKIDQSSSEVSHENNGQKANAAKTFYISLNANDRLRLRYNVSTNNGDTDFPANTCNLSVYRLGSN